MAAGLVRDTDLWAAAGVPCDDGVLVDASCRTAVPGVFAAGDVAAQDHPRYGRQRVEHHDSARRQGTVAAAAMLGADVVHDAPHWFWSDQYHHTLQSCGDHAAARRHRGRRAGRGARAHLRRAGRRGR